MLPYKTNDLDPRLHQILHSLAAGVSSNDYPAVTVLIRSLSQLLTLKITVSRLTRARLIKLLYAIATSPGSDSRLIELSCIVGGRLIKSKEMLDGDLELEWRVLHDALERILYPKVGGVGFNLWLGIIYLDLRFE
jgi:hypothetical protein